MMSKDDQKSIVCYVPFGDEKGYKLAEEFKKKASKEGCSIKIKRGKPPVIRSYPGIH
jgi:hypothetical protein